MADPYATLTDYQVRTKRTLTGAAGEQVTALLADASAIVRGSMPAGWTPDADIARSTVVAMVQRAVINPGGRRYRQVGSTSEGYEERTGLYLTSEEEAQLLLGYDEYGASGAYTVGLRDEAFPPLGGW